MSQIGQDKHDFLYYIFQFDKDRCIMNPEKENRLQKQIRETIQAVTKGDQIDG